MFYFLQKLSVPPFKKLTPFPLFELKNFLTCRNRFFTKMFFPNFGRWGCKCHDIVKSAGCQTNNISSKHDNIIAEFCKNFYQRTNLKNLGSRKYQKNLKLGGDRCQFPVSFLEIIKVIAVEIIHCRCRIVDVYYSWEELVTMGVSFKTVIISKQ